MRSIRLPVADLKQVLDFIKLYTIEEINYLDKCEKRRCAGHHKQFKTLLREHMVKLKIISLYIYRKT